METTTFEDAVMAYTKYCKKNGIAYCQPNQAMSEVGRKYVHLKNINGELAKYEIATGKIVE